MGLVVDDQNVCRIREFAEHFLYVGFVAFCAALVHASSLLDLRVGFPIECMPIPNDDPALPQHLSQRNRHDIEFVVVIFGAEGIENLKPAFYR